MRVIPIPFHCKTHADTRACNFICKTLNERYPAKSYLSRKYDIQFEKMSFPMAGTTTEIGNWLRTKSISEPVVTSFGVSDTEAMLNVSEVDRKRKVPEDEGTRLWAQLCFSM